MGIRKSTKNMSRVECNFILGVSYRKKTGFYHVSKSMLQHNHEVSRDDFQKLTEDEKVRYAPLIVDNALSLSALVDKIQEETGKKVTNKDIYNLRNRFKVGLSRVHSKQLELEAAPLIADRMSSMPGANYQVTYDDESMENRTVEMLYCQKDDMKSLDSQVIFIEELKAVNYNHYSLNILSQISKNGESLSTAAFGIVLSKPDKEPSMVRFLKTCLSRAAIKPHVVVTSLKYSLEGHETLADMNWRILEQASTAFPNIFFVTSRNVAIKNMNNYVDKLYLPPVLKCKAEEIKKNLKKMIVDQSETGFDEGMYSLAKLKTSHPLLHDLLPQVEKAWGSNSKLYAGYCMSELGIYREVGLESEWSRVIGQGFKRFPDVVEVLLQKGFQCIATSRESAKKKPRIYWLDRSSTASYCNLSLHSKEDVSRKSFCQSYHKCLLKTLLDFAPVFLGRTVTEALINELEASFEVKDDELLGHLTENWTECTSAKERCFLNQQDNLPCRHLIRSLFQNSLPLLTSRLVDRSWYEDNTVKFREWLDLKHTDLMIGCHKLSMNMETVALISQEFKKLSLHRSLKSASEGILLFDQGLTLCPLEASGCDFHSSYNLPCSHLFTIRLCNQENMILPEDLKKIKLFYSVDS